MEAVIRAGDEEVMLYWLVIAVLLVGATDREATVFESEYVGGGEKVTCVALRPNDNMASDAIVTVVYRQQVRLGQMEQPQQLIRSKTITFPVYEDVTSMGDCVSVRLADVERVEVRWVMEVHENRGPSDRDAKVREAFQRANPCPANGKTSGSCPGYVADHIYPLCFGGKDAVENMTWQKTGISYLKDRFERDACAVKRKYEAIKK